jgi:hypothetical protein
MLSMPEELKNTTIEEIITMRLHLQGYQSTNKNPDFSVSYRLFYGNPNFHGYKLETSKEMEKRRSYGLLNRNLINKEAATLLISFTDAKEGNVIFQSFVKGIFFDPNLIDKNQLQMAVHHIFDEYKIYAARIYANRSKPSRNLSNVF